jgi:hypothetical protein
VSLQLKSARMRTLSRVCDAFKRKMRCGSPLLPGVAGTSMTSLQPPPLRQVKMSAQKARNSKMSRYTYCEMMILPFSAQTSFAVPNPSRR